jgi:ankyrin repeat protein
MTSDDEYCKALDIPAPTLFAIYERLLLRLQSRPKSTQALVRSVLIWILFSPHSLSMKELCEAVTIPTGSKEKPSAVALNQIRKFCSSLIREAANGNHLEAAHFTVKEFFCAITKESHPHISYFCLSKEEAYLEFSKVCLTYLNFKDFHKSIPPFESLLDAFEDYPFYSHAASLWISYAKNHWNNDDVLRLAKQLFKPPMSTNFKLWRNRVISNDEFGSELMERINRLGDSPLHWAAYLGIHQLLEWLVSYGQDIDSAAALGTPLSAAVSRGEYDITWQESIFTVPLYSFDEMCELRYGLCEETVQTCVKTLIQRGARTEHIFECKISGKIYNLSLHEVLLYSVDIKVLEMESLAIEFFDEHVAARMKHVINLSESARIDSGEAFTLREQVVQMLRGMKRAYIAPEFRFAFNGYVKELEDNITPDYEAMREVWKAARNDQADVLESLLKERGGIKINELLDDSVDSNLDEDDEGYYDSGKNALHCAASAGSFECIKVLMYAGASVHITTDDGNTALHFAAKSPNIGAKQCVELLVDAGLSLDAKNDVGWTTLHCAAFSGNKNLVEFLLGKGLDPHLSTCTGNTAYHVASSSGSGDVLKLLLEHEKGGISGMHVSGEDGLKPAQMAVVENKSVFIGKLLKHIDIKELAVEEEPFILYVAREGSAEMMKVVLSLNPDVSVRGRDQSTILHAMMVNDNMAENYADFQQIIRDAIRKGVSRSDARTDGSKPLHLLLSGRQPVKEELLDLMIEGKPNYVDGKRDNYLMCLLRSHRSALQKIYVALDLIKLGVNPFQKNKKGEFFYHQFTETYPVSVLRIAPHINDLKKMDKVHWSLSKWLTIHFAITKGDLSLVKSLLEKGSSLSKQTGYREFNVAGRQFYKGRLNCMHLAALYGWKDILEYILGASNLPIDCREEGGCTALHLAALNGSDGCVKLLLSKGADAKIQDNCGNNALHYALGSKAPSVIEMLIEARTPIVANQTGDNPIDLAMKDTHGDITELLRKYQASRDDGDYDDLSSVDEIHEVVSSDLPFIFGSTKNQHTFEFNSPLTLDLSKAN